MRRPHISIVLLVLPALALGALCVAIVATAGSRAAVPGSGAAAHFVVRQLVGLGLGLALGFVAVRVGAERILRAAPALFVVALVATAAVFIPGVGVRAAGASRWLKLGPFSGSPAPFLIGATGLLVAAWGGSGRPLQPLASRPIALALALLALLVLVAEPDFSAAAVVLAVVAAALGGGGVASRRLIPAALLLLAVLAIGASRFGYVEKRVAGFMSPETDRRGKGFEVLALARANAGAAGAAGLGNGNARRHLSSPASDYVFAVVGEELGRKGTWGVVGVWAVLVAGATLAARSAGRDPRLRAAAASCAAALLAPAALHIAVCRGWTPIMGVTMPFLSYDPALTVASGGELGVLAAIALAADHGPGDQASA